MLKKSLFMYAFIIGLLCLSSCNESEEGPQIPSISGISPSSWMTNSPDFLIIVSGQNFTSDSVVIFRDVALATTYVNDTTLHALVTNGLTIQATAFLKKGGLPLQDKQVSVKVQNSAGTSDQRSFTFYDNWNFQALANINSGEAAIGLDMSMAQNADGFLYAVWSHMIYTETGKLGATITGLELWFSRSENGGASWTAPQKINGSLSLDPFDYLSPQIMMGANNAIYVMFTRNDPALYYSFLWMTASADNGTTWSEPTLVNPTAKSYIPKAEFSPSFYIEPLTKNMHNTWSGMTFGFKYAIYYSRSIAQTNALENSINSSFSEPIRISDYTNVMQGNSEVTANNIGDVCAVWFQPVFNSYYTKELWTASSTDGGNFFGEQQCIADKSQINQWGPMPDLTIDQQGNVYIVYVGPFNGTVSDIMLQKSSDHGATFSSSINLTNSTGTCLSPFITSDTLGNLTLIYQVVANSRATICCRRSTDGGSSFSAAVTVGTVNLPPEYSAAKKKNPKTPDDFYPQYAPMDRVFMTMMNKPLISLGNYYSTISVLDWGESFDLFTLQFSLGTGER